MNALSRTPAIVLSGSLHAALIFVAAVTLFWKPKVTEVLDFDVVQPARQALTPTQSAPPPNTKPKPKLESAQRQVFGASRKAILADSSDDAAPSVKTGNTVAKAQDDLKLKTSDADALPIPADEFLVSRMPVLIADFRAPYPPEARKKGLQGAVVFDLLIDSSGIVRQATFVSGPGGGLNEAAASAVERLKFKPAIIDDKPVAVRIRYAYRFVLER